MTTATKPKGKTAVLDELEALELVVHDLRVKAKVAGGEHQAAVNHIQGLHDQRQRLTYAEPGLVDHTGQPLETIENNPVANLDEALGKVPDLADLQARYAHATRLADRAQREAEGYSSANLDALLGALEGEGQELADQVNAAVHAAADRATALVGYCQRLAGLAAAAGQNTRVKGEDDASALARELGRWTIECPRLWR